MAWEEVHSAEERLVSILTSIELLAGANDEEEERSARQLLRVFRVVPVDDVVAQHAGRIRRTKRLKLPGAIVYATALAGGCQLTTRDTRDFSEDDPIIRVPYRL
ncbi:MAG: type II toxin-antitoxin system VapC family toxin [Chloroflexi bacterium]|nr:PIN domain-containing protein [Dehalococcoidia bacterium]NJD64530.1 type II toxin-antitoxin system VapC family toxin [Chloroflexota bacterium]PWB71979.1 MAG: VapC toxin family PIN domain ribonuclease [Holophagae bacterium]